MNRLLRNVIALFVGIILGGASVVALAQSQGTYPANKRWITESVDQNHYSGAVAACQGLASMVGETYYGTTGYFSGVVPPLYLDSYHYCSWRRYSSPTCPVGQYCGFNSGVKTKPEMYCLSGGTLSADKTTCNVTCPAGQTWDDSSKQCLSDCPAAGTEQSSGWFLMGSSPSSSFPGVTCAGNCLVSFNGYAPAGQAIVGGQTQYYARGTWQYLGPSNTCSGGTATPGAQSSLPPDTCGPNQYYGTINGKPVCIDATTGQPAQTTPPPSPSTTTTQTDNTTNPDGSTTKTTTTTNPDGSTTTTTTTTQPNGNSTTTTTTTPPPGEDQTDDFCKKNPDSPMCQEIESGSPAGTSDLYTPESRTVGNVLSDFRGKIQNAPFYSGASNFFNISVPGGSCGGMNAQIAVGWGQSFNIDIDSVLCGSTAQLVYSVLGIGVMLAAAWVAFRIAIL